MTAERPASTPVDRVDATGQELRLPDSVDDVTYDSWGVLDTETGWFAFTDDNEEAAAKRLRNLAAKRPNLVLARRTCRTRTLKWYGETQIIPWHSPCDWIAAGDEQGRQIGPAHCMTHGHSEGEPVPAEHIRGAVIDGVSADA